MDSGGRLAGKVVVVTGGASGMGASHARSLAREGAVVAITDIAEDAGSALAEEVGALGGEASFHRHDVADAEGWRQVVTDVERAHGAVDVLVNNAGVQVRSAGIEADDREWDLVTSVNQRGIFLGMRAVIPGMAARGGGSIVNIASVAALSGCRGRSRTRPARPPCSGSPAERPSPTGAKHPRQRDLPRARRHRDDGERVGGHRRGHDGADPARP